MTFNPAISLGDVLMLAGTVTAVLGAFFSLRGDVRYLSRVVKELGESHEGNARQLASHERRLAELDAAVFGRRRGDREA